MPSLLDMMAQRNPMMGLLAQQNQQGPQPAAPQTPPAPAGLLSQGQEAPSPIQARQMQEEQARQAAAQRAPLESLFRQAGRAAAPNQKLDIRETLVNTGLALLSGDRNQVSYGQAIAAGLMAGRQAAAQNNLQKAQEAQAQQRANQYLSVLGDGPLNAAKIDDAIKVATIRGDEAALKVFSDLRDKMPDDSELLERTKTELPDGSIGFVDKNGSVFNADGERLSADQLADVAEAEKDMGWEVKQYGNLQVRVSSETGLVRELGTGRLVSPEEIRASVAAEKPRDVQLRTFKRADGTEVEAVWNNATNSFIPGTELIVDFPDGGKEDTSVLAESLRSNVAQMRTLLGDDPNTENFEGSDAFRQIGGEFGYVSRFVPDSMKGDTAQSFSIYAQDSLSLILQQRSGATVSDAERERLEAVVLPKPGDTAEAVARKIGKLEEIIAIYERGGGNAANNALRATIGLPPIPGTRPDGSRASQATSRLNALGG